MKHIQQRDGRWCIGDLVGKHGRVRTVPMPTCVKIAIDAWTSVAGVADGHVFRTVNRGGQAQAGDLNEKVVWQLLQGYATAAGVPGIAPHNLRRTCAALCWVASTSRSIHLWKVTNAKLAAASESSLYDRR